MSAVPTPYNVTYDFSSYQIANPNDPLPGDEVDSELAAIETSLDETQSRLLELQNDDGTLRDQTQDWELTGHLTATRLTASTRIDTALLYIGGYMVLPEAVALANEAADVSYDNATSGLAANSVQAALDELADEKVDDFTTTGADATIVSGTAGADGNLAEWNTDGDAVDSGIATDDVVLFSDTTGMDVTVVSGTAGTNGNLAQWNGDGDLVDAGGTLAGRVPTSRALTAGAGLTGGGDLSADRSFAVESPAFAWGNFNGTGTVALRDSYNVSSITDQGTGSYQVNFTTSAGDANYAAVVCANNNAFGEAQLNAGPADFQAGSFDILTTQLSEAVSNNIDADIVTFVVFGG